MGRVEKIFQYLNTELKESQPQGPWSIYIDISQAQAWTKIDTADGKVRKEN